MKLTFDRTDHPPVFARGGQLALVVSPTICNVRLKRVLIDDGAALNIISPMAFDIIKAPGMKLKPLLPIIGMTPGHTWPLSHIELPVTFGDPTNFRTERLDFDMADLNLPYNTVLTTKFGKLCIGFGDRIKADLEEDGGYQDRAGIGW